MIEQPVAPFARVTLDGNRVRAVLRNDPTVGGQDVCFYVAGCAHADDLPLWEQLGWGHALTDDGIDRSLEPAVRAMLQYLATKDRNGTVRVAFAASGPDSQDVELVGELAASTMDRAPFDAPHHPGAELRLAPAVRDAVDYLRRQAKSGATGACAVFVGDGPVRDADEVRALTAKIAADTAEGRYPPMSLLWVGIGPTAAAPAPGWHTRAARTVRELPDAVCALVDACATVAKGASVLDAHGRPLVRMGDRLPAVLEFDVPDGCAAFTVEIGGVRYTQPLPDGDDG
jgi:hypothetical protein